MCKYLCVGIISCLNCNNLFSIGNCSIRALVFYSIKFIKYYSSIWANRIKKHLPNLIGKNQTGFVENRFIGENTRLTLDTLTESQFENLNGLLILVDFEKAFDSISWDYISKILKLLNFSDQTIQVIKSLQKKSIAKILQNGHSSENIMLQRGCRQGDPISPYIFGLAVELLG